MSDLPSSIPYPLPAEVLPAGLQVRRAPEAVVIRRTWRQPNVAFFILWVVLWDGILLGYYIMGASDGTLTLSGALVPLVHVVIGAAMTYYVLAQFFNYTDISISATEVTVTSGPLPFGGEARVPCADIKDLTVREEASGYSSVYTLRYVTRINIERELLKLDDYEQMKFIVETLRVRLGLRGGGTVRGVAVARADTKKA